IPAIDNRIVAELGKQMQIYPAERIYLKPGTLSKTSSGKIKHKENRDQLKNPAIKGLICRLPELPDISGDTAETAESVIKLFQQWVGVKPELNRAIHELSNDNLKIQRFVNELQEIYPLPDCELADWIEEKTTLTELIAWLDEQLWSGMVPI
ncbi:MAG: hypothetical protein HQ517_00005, partial [SAR324 cluster bacterium]|nr:hypothetical protein [SAR324 cluster bacterium]